MYALFAEIHCHGVRLTSAIAEPADEGHEASVTLVEDEYYVEIHHEMTRSHYISFAAAISFDGIQTSSCIPKEMQRHASSAVVCR